MNSHYSLAENRGAKQKNEHEDENARRIIILGINDSGKEYLAYYRKINFS